jgi:hypothetical protein
MKRFMITSIMLALFAAGSTLMAQERQEDYLGLPGDNLNLYAVMKLFQQSKTLEDFERSLNDPKSNINNLDLNGDNLVDYIKVFDDVDGDVHNIVLQVAVSPRENQDVAVFTVQRFNNGQVQVQLTGDEQLYGKNYIVEPIFDNEAVGTPNPGYTGPNRSVTQVTYVRTTPFEIATWPLIRFIYLPTYTVWHSSWYWGYYPHYWHPWTPFSWHYYYGYHYHWYNDYYGHYRRWDYHRYSRWNDYYYVGRRSFSPDVNHRIEIGTYKSAYSHPEDRKRGEEVFAKKHPQEYRRSTAMLKQNNNAGPSDNHQNQISQPESRRNNNDRKSNNSITNRSVNNPSGSNNQEVNRRSTETVKNRSVDNHPSSNSNVTTRKSSTTVVNRSVSNPGNNQNQQVNKTTVQHKSTTVNNTNRRNSANKVKSDNGTKKENSSKESVKKENRRN